MLDHDTDLPLKHVSLLLTREETEGLVRDLQALLATGNGYARVEDVDWGDCDVSLYTPETMEFLHRRSRRLIETGE
jgi:hypothetical protein